jgi:hypothetical protein
MMPSNFPASADSFSNPNPLSSLDSPSHALQHTNANDAIEAVETYLIANTFTSPTLAGTPVAPTATADTDTTQLATTAFVLGQKGTTTPLMDEVNGGQPGSSLKYAREDHYHPSDTTRQRVRLFTTLANGTTAMALGTNQNVEVTPTATATFTTTTLTEGNLAVIKIITSGTTSYTITFGSGFRTQGTLATGTVTARHFVITFMAIDGSMTEISRTTAMA